MVNDMMKRMVVLLGLICWLGVAAAAQAQSGYPPRTDRYVNDLAEVIETEDRGRIQTTLQTLYAEHGVEMTVLTIWSIHDYDRGDSTIESFATNLFNQWGIGDADRNDGVLLLVALDDRELRIELGAGYGPADEDGLGSIIDRLMVPQFREGNYSLGIVEGVEAMAARLRGEPEPLWAAASPTTASSSQPVRSGRNILWWAGGGTVALLGASNALLTRWRRYRRRTCPACQLTEMTRLGELEDDAFLQEGQRLEESLKSVDYDVWQCPNCQHYEVIPFVAWFSHYKKCRQCQYRAMETKSTVLQQPTYSSTGLEERVSNCHHCSYHHRTTHVIPRKTQSSSSSSGSFSSSSSSSSSRSSSSGGSSSGGGRSGKW